MSWNLCGKELNEKERFICPRAETCDYSDCMHKIPHKHDSTCDNNCKTNYGLLAGGTELKCVTYKNPKIRTYNCSPEVVKYAEDKFWEYDERDTFLKSASSDAEYVVVDSGDIGETDFHSYHTIEGAVEHIKRITVEKSSDCWSFDALFHGGKRLKVKVEINVTVKVL